MLGNKSLYLLIALGLFGIAFIFAYTTFYGVQGGGSSVESSIDYNGYVQIETTGSFDGRESPAHEGIVEKVYAGPIHNVLYNLGKNLTRDLLLNPASVDNNISRIGLCNSTNASACATPLATDQNITETTGATAVFEAYNTCGLGTSVAEYNILTGYNGNATLSNTFTSSCDAKTTNVTRLYDASGNHFAGVAFTEVTLQTNDQLLINWTISIP